METLCGLGCKELMNGSNLSRGINSKQAFTKDIHFHLPYGLCCGHQLTVDIAGAHAIGIDNCQMFDTRPH